MGVDVNEAGLDVGDAVRIVRGFGLLKQRIALEIGLENHVDKTFRSVGRFLRQTTDAPLRRNGDAAGLGRQFTVGNSPRIA